MVRGWVAGLALAGVLAACGTPQEQCINGQTRDLRNVERLIADTQAALARGYGYESVEVTDTRWVVCGYDEVGTDGNGKAVLRARYCFDDYTRTERRPVAIDPVAEKRKLDGLVRKRAELLRAAQPVIAECKARFPE
jgi:ribulose bisphosphate carboxylase small subunit